MTDVLKIHADDNVYVPLSDFSAGEVNCGDSTVNLPQAVPQRHKFLEAGLTKGEEVLMYGMPVGPANEDLPAGALLTIENTSHYAEPVTQQGGAPCDWQAPDVSKWQDKTFLGYHRTGGRVGTANYWLFIPLVFFENRNLKCI
jgi:altronate hydrolase